MSAPSSASRTDTPRPMPTAEPVTTATLPSRSLDIFVPLLQLGPPTVQLADARLVAK